MRRINPILPSFSPIDRKTKNYLLRNTDVRSWELGLIVPPLKYLLLVGVVGINQSMKNELPLPTRESHELSGTRFL